MHTTAITDSYLGYWKFKELEDLAHGNAEYHFIFNGLSIIFQNYIRAPVEVAQGKESICQCRRCKRGRFVSGQDPLEKEMATHSSILAWRIPWTEERGGLQSMGSQRVRHD